MANVLVYSILLILATLWPLASTYKIDSSCQLKGIDANIRDGMTSAFQIADAALRRLREQPLDQHTLDLVGFLFAREGAHVQQIFDEGGMVNAI